MITFIPTPIGNPQDITIRAMKIFEKTEIFLCEDTRETKKLLKLLEERFDLVYPDAIFYSFNEHNGEERIGQLADDLLVKEIVYVSDAGMPVISDPGQKLVEYCQEKKIKYDVLPGASAVVTAYAASGFREGKFTFYGFLPHKGKERSENLRAVMQSEYNMVLYESPHRLQKLLNEIASMDKHREIFLAKEISKRYQTYFKGTAETVSSDMKESHIRGEWVVVIAGHASEEKSFSYGELLEMDLPPKIKAKMLAKLSDKSIKEWYETLISSKN